MMATKNKLGNPEQDNEILEYLRNKKYKVKRKKYNMLPDWMFEYE